MRFRRMVMCMLLRLVAVDGDSAVPTPPSDVWAKDTNGAASTAASRTGISLIGEAYAYFARSNALRKTE